MGLVPVLEEAPESLLTFLPWEGSRKTGIYGQEGGFSLDKESDDTWILDYPGSRTVRITCMLFINHTMYDETQQPEWTKTE